MFTIPNLQDPADTKTGRHVNGDRSVSPTRDTGFRMPAGTPTFTYNPPAKGSNAVMLPDYIHADDIIDEGPAIIRGEKVNAVRLISVNLEGHVAREQKYLDESIQARRKREKKENDASKN
jgi:hypothetical protein